MLECALQLSVGIMKIIGVTLLIIFTGIYFFSFCVLKSLSLFILTIKYFKILIITLTLRHFYILPPTGEESPNILCNLYNCVQVKNNNDFNDVPILVKLQ